VRRGLGALGPQPQDPWLRLLGRVRQRLRARRRAGAAGHAGPRQIAQACHQPFRRRMREGLADWLLRLEAQRYARRPPTELPTLQRELNRLPWPGPR
jgi:hypothetical protein